MITKNITYFGKSAIIGCDGKCEKAWGINARPKIEVDRITFMKSDDELGAAPLNPGTYEGGCAKPTNKEQMLNKWCCRECERCDINDIGTAPVPESLKLPDFSVRRRM